MSAVISLIKHAGGRPTKYDPALIEPMLDGFSNGMSRIEVAVNILGITQETMRVWVATNAEFSAAVKIGEEMSQAWWQEKGRSNLQTEVFRDALWYMNMKNRFGWRDKQELTGDPEKPIAVSHHIEPLGIVELRDAFESRKLTDES